MNHLHQTKSKKRTPFFSVVKMDQFRADHNCEFRYLYQFKSGFQYLFINFQGTEIKSKFILMFTRNLFKGLSLLSAISMPSLICAEKKRYQIYMWGNGAYQARPDAILQFKNYTPKLIKNLPQNLKHLQFGQYYEAGITQKGQLFVWQKRAIDSNVGQQKDETRDNIRSLEKSGVKQVKFTQGYIWALTDKEKVFQWPIIKEFDDDKNIISTKLGQKREVDPLKGSVQLSCGSDHIITLNNKGQVFAMGEDTLGQCGQCDTDRHTHPPFTTKRIKFPSKVKNLPKIKKIVAGGNHNLALDESGNLFGWGSNSVLQLSHEQEHAAMTRPLLCSYSPIRISKNLDSSEILDIVCGSQFSFVVTNNKNTNSCELYSFGHNTRGQLGINQIRQLKDISRVEALSNYMIKMKGQQKKVVVKELKCGDRHCIALLNIGYIMEWGDNEHGQMGNKKRSPVGTPSILKDFMNKKVVGVYAGSNSSAVIVQVDEEEVSKK